MMFIDKLYS